jgi:uncharacterized RDD family membrane protein YckC
LVIYVLLRAATTPITFLAVVTVVAVAVVFAVMGPGGHSEFGPLWFACTALYYSVWFCFMAPGAATKKQTKKEKRGGGNGGKEASR